MSASPPEGSPDREPVITSRERAGIGLRVYVAVLGLVGIAMGLMFLNALAEVPTWCRWLMCIFAPFFAVGGAVMLFFSLRGRKTELQELTGCTSGKDAVKNDADIAATSATAHVVCEIIDKIS
jgi:hypothetical protein